MEFGLKKSGGTIRKRPLKMSQKYQKSQKVSKQLRLFEIFFFWVILKKFVKKYNNA